MVDLDCEVYSDLWGEAIVHRATHVSENGVWIQTELLLEVGSEVTLTFHPPDWDEPLCVAGCVRRVELKRGSAQGGGAGMGIGFEALRSDERRRLTRSMRCLRAEEAFILDQRTLTGVPVGVPQATHPSPAGTGRTLAGWSAPSAAPPYSGRPSRITATPAERQRPPEKPERAFTGGLDLAASVFSADPKD
jgi:Tfp pilus assembly protein PilZ